MKEWDGLKIQKQLPLWRWVGGMLGKVIVFLLITPTPHGFCFTQPPESRHESGPIYLQIVCRMYSLDDARIPREIAKSLDRPAVLTYRDTRGTIWRAAPLGLIETHLADNSTRVLTGKDGLPILSVTGVAGGGDGRLWLATDQGAVLFIPGGGSNAQWFYFAGQRYLRDDHVLKIVPGKYHAWIRTRTGISLIEFKPYTLEQKSDLFLKRIQQRHNRYGYVAESDLLRSGDPASFRMAPTDNDGLWTSIYLAAECFRYATTHSESALRNARTSLAAMLRLVSITGIPGLPARSLMHKGDYRDPSGEWHWTPDGEWEWKGDTSSDELVGHFFAYWVAYKLLPGDEDRTAIRSAVSSIANGLIDHQLHLVGYKGRVTTWGRYDPSYLKTVEGDERALDSLEVLSHLRVAYQITGDPKILDAYRRIGSDLGYVQNVVRYTDEKPQEINYSDEELAFLSFYPLLDSESDPELHRQYQTALTKLWQRVRSERNPLWDFIYASNSGDKSYDCTDASETLNRIPLSTISWTVKNSQRDDLVDNQQAGRFGESQTQNAIPPNERPVMKWNGNPFRLDGGDNGRSEDDGAFFLLPYWLGRYYHLLSCPQ
jgi:hypothetical protein